MWQECDGLATQPLGGAEAARLSEKNPLNSLPFGESNVRTQHNVKCTRFHQISSCVVIKSYEDGF